MLGHTLTLKYCPSTAGHRASLIASSTQTTLDSPSLAPINDYTQLALFTKMQVQACIRPGCMSFLNCWKRWGVSVQRSCATTCSVSEHMENKATHFKHTPNADIQNILLFVILTGIKMYFYVFWTYKYEYSALNYSKQDQKDTLRYPLCCLVSMKQQNLRSFIFS